MNSKAYVVTSVLLMSVANTVTSGIQAQSLCEVPG